MKRGFNKICPQCAGSPIFKKYIKTYNKCKKCGLKLSDYKDKEISFSFMKYINKFNIEDSNYKVKWSFNPLKIFQLNANQ